MTRIVFAWETFQGQSLPLECEVEYICNDLLAAKANSGASEVLIWEKGVQSDLVIGQVPTETLT